MCNTLAYELCVPSESGRGKQQDTETPWTLRDQTTDFQLRVSLIIINVNSNKYNIGEVQLRCSKVT